MFQDRVNQIMAVTLIVLETATIVKAIYRCRYGTCPKLATVLLEMIVLFVVLSFIDSVLVIWLQATR